MKPNPYGLFAVAPLVACGHAYYWSFFLPERVATHFGADGVPNAWNSSSTAIGMYLATVIGLSGFLFAITALLGVLPTSVINVPNRDYWFAPERRAQSVARIGWAMSVFAVGVGLFLIAVFHLTFVASATQQNLPLTTGMPYILLFLLFVVGFVVSLFRMFPAPPKDSPTDPAA